VLVIELLSENTILTQKLFVLADSVSILLDFLNVECAV
jgi:hypothetical protein